MSRVARTLIFLCLLYPALAWSAPGIGASCTGSAAGVSSISITPCTASGVGRLSVAGFMFGNNDVSVNAVTYGGDAMTLALTNGFTPPDLETRQYYRIAPATGSQTFTLTFSGNVNVAAGVTAFTGVHQTTPIGTPVKNTPSGTGTSASVVVTSAAGELVVDALGLCNSAGVTPGGGQASQYSVLLASNDINIDSSTEAGAASVTTSWTWTNDNCNMLISTPLKPAAAAATRRTGPMVLP